jgi:hypothetical protein
MIGERHDNPGAGRGAHKAADLVAAHRRTAGSIPATGATHSEVAAIAFSSRVMTVWIDEWDDLFSQRERKGHEMGQDFEFRDDPKRAATAVGCPVQLCPVKWQAAKAAIDYVRELDRLNPTGKGANIARLLDQAGLTTDFEPSPVPSVQTHEPQRPYNDRFIDRFGNLGI